MTTTRRSLLQGLGAGLGLGLLGAPRLASGALTGDTTVPCGPFKILDIFLTGALSHRDALWVDDPAEGWAPWRVDPDMTQVPGAGNAQKILFKPASDHAVYLGAGFTPLLPTGALGRTRLVALRTFGAGDHVVRTAHTMAGVELGRPGFVSPGARVAARYLDGAPVLPSWVVDAEGRAQYRQFATATGTLGAQYRPFVVPVGSNDFKTSMNRTGRERVDDLLTTYRRTYAGDLTHGSARVRSDAFDSYEDAVNRIIDWPAVYEVLNKDGNNDSPSLDATNGMLHQNKLTAGISFGVHLLKQGARHVTVVGGQGAYPRLDTHENNLDPDNGPTDYQFHAIRHNGVMWGAMKAIADALDSGLLDLDDTMIVLRSEFGRYNDDNNGTEHQLSGYAGIVMGGPVKAPALAGELAFSDDDKNGKAVGGFAPLDIAAGVALAAGVDPFQPGLFDPADLTEPAANAQAGREWLATDLLGADLNQPPNDCAVDKKLP
jgi:hypothetical protein